MALEWMLLIWFLILTFVKNASCNVCGRAQFVETSGTIVSPNHPSDYPNNINCTYVISNTLSPSDKSSIEIRINYLRIEVNEHCKYDWLQIWCSNPDHGYIRKICGHRIPPPSFSYFPCSKLLIEFRSDNTDVRAGFNLTFYQNKITEVTTALTTTEKFDDLTTINTNSPSTMTGHDYFTTELPAIFQFLSGLGTHVTSFVILVMAGLLGLFLLILLVLVVLLVRKSKIANSVFKEPHQAAFGENMFNNDVHARSRTEPRINNSCSPAENSCSSAGITGNIQCSAGNNNNNVPVEQTTRNCYNMTPILQKMMTTTLPYDNDDDDNEDNAYQNIDDNDDVRIKDDNDGNSDDDDDLIPQYEDIRNL